MPTYYARDQYTYSGTNAFTITFPYLREAHVEVFVNDVQVDAADLTFLTASSIRVDDPALVTDDVVVVRRRTSPTARMVDWEADGIIREVDLDEDSKQAFYMAQEAMDRAQQAFAEAGGNTTYP